MHDALHTVSLVVHAASGTVGLLIAPIAMLAPKRPGWHPRLGLTYQAAIALLTVSTFGLVAVKPTVWWLGLIAVGTEAAALGGWWVRRHPRPGWRALHLRLMSGSYIALLTAFGVVVIGWPVLWALPSVVGTPLILWAVHRERHRGPAPATPAQRSAATGVRGLTGARRG